MSAPKVPLARPGCRDPRAILARSAPLVRQVPKVRRVPRARRAVLVRQVRPAPLASERPVPKVPPASPARLVLLAPLARPVPKAPQGPTPPSPAPRDRLDPLVLLARPVPTRRFPDPLVRRETQVTQARLVPPERRDPKAPKALSVRQAPRAILDLLAPRVRQAQTRLSLALQDRLVPLDRLALPDHRDRKAT